MEIWILRHAKAEDGGPTTPDEERELTDGGHETIRSVARAVARLEPKLDAIFTSPLVRARQTAEPVARALSMEDKLIESDALVPDADPKAILREIGRRGLSRAMVVGHMPHLGRLLGYLLTGRPDSSIDLKKAALARIQFDGDAPKPPGTLIFLLTAKELSGRLRP